MTETEYFKDSCRALAHSLHSSLFFKDLVKRNKKAESDGVVARFRFDGFFVDINLYVKGKRAAVPNLVMLYCGFLSDEDVLFSVYDIFALLEINDFKSYTYPCVFEKKQFDAVFCDIKKLFEKLLPALSGIAENGALKNRILEQKKNEIREFCKNPDLFNPAVPYNDVYLRLSEIIIDSFYENEITNLVSGTLSLAPKGKRERAKSSLASKKHKSLYEKRLLAFLCSEESEGFDFSPLGEAEKEFKENLKKENRGTALKTFLYTLAFFVPTFAVLFAIYLLLCAVMFKNAVFTVISGLSGGIILAVPAILLSVIFASLKIDALQKKPPKKSDGLSRSGEGSKKPLKAALAVVEFLALLSCLFAANTTCAFYDNAFTVEETSVFSVSQTKYNYSDVDYIEVTFDGINSPYYSAVLKDGSSVFLFDATNSAEKQFKKYAPRFFFERGIDVNFRDR